MTRENMNMPIIYPSLACWHRHSAHSLLKNHFLDIRSENFFGLHFIRLLSPTRNDQTKVKWVGDYHTGKGSICLVILLFVIGKYRHLRSASPNKRLSGKDELDSRSGSRRKCQSEWTDVGPSVALPCICAVTRNRWFSSFLFLWFHFLLNGNCRHPSRLGSHSHRYDRLEASFLIHSNQSDFLRWRSSRPWSAIHLHPIATDHWTMKTLTGNSSSSRVLLQMVSAWMILLLYRRKENWRTRQEKEYTSVSNDKSKEWV